MCLESVINCQDMIKILAQNALEKAAEYEIEKIAQLIVDGQPLPPDLQINNVEVEMTPFKFT